MFLKPPLFVLPARRIFFLAFFLACLVIEGFPSGKSVTADQQVSSERIDVRIAEVVSFDQNFSFSPHESEQGRIINHFLQKIAEGTGKLRAYTQYAFAGSILVGVATPEQGKCSVELSLRGAGLSGDLIYRDFSLEKVLIPDRASFSMEVFSSGGRSVHSQRFHDLAFSSDGSVFLRHPLPFSCQVTDLSFRITGLEFSYTEEVYARFGEWMGVIESYYEGSRMLDAIPSLVDGLSFSDPERILLDEFRLCEAEQILSQLRYAPFREWIRPGGGDPESVNPRLNAYSARADSLRFSFNLSISRIDTLFYEKGLVALEEERKNKGRELFESALVYNPFHIGAHYALANLDHQDLDHLEALSRLGEVLSRIYPSGFWLEKTRLLAGEVLGAIFKEGDELIRENRFLDALALLGEVEAFCRSTSGRFPCPGTLVDLQILAHTGMFRSFLIVSERALANDNLSFCVAYIRNALAYEKENQPFITGSADARLLLQKVVNRHLQKAEDFWRQGNGSGSTEQMLLARKLCETYDFLDCEWPSTP